MTPEDIERIDTAVRLLQQDIDRYDREDPNWREHGETLTDRVIMLSRRDYEVLTNVAHMYLTAVEEDPELEFVSGTQALVLTELREAVARADEYFIRSPVS